MLKRGLIYKFYIRRYIMANWLINFFWFWLKYVSQRKRVVFGDQTWKTEISNILYLLLSFLQMCLVSWASQNVPNQIFHVVIKYDAVSYHDLLLKEKTETLLLNFSWLNSFDVYLICPQELILKWDICLKHFSFLFWRVIPVVW